MGTESGLIVEKSEVSVEVLTDPRRVYTLLETHDYLRAWTSLDAPSLGRHWIAEFCRAYGEGKQVFVVVAYTAGRPCLVVPLQLVSPTAAIFLCDDGTDHNDLLWFSPDVQMLEQALRFLANRGLRSLLLSRLPEDTDTIGLFWAVQSYIPSFVLVEHGEPIPYIECKKTVPIDKWPDVNIHRIIYLRNRRAKLERKHSCTVRVLKDVAEIETLLPTFFEMHKNRWRQKTTVSKYSHENRRTFTRAICVSALRRNELFLPVLEIDGQIAAYILGFRSGQTIFDWNTSFDMAWRRWSPGALLLLEVLERSTEFEISTYDLLRGADSYKFDWTSKTRTNRTLFCSFLSA